MMKSRIAVLVLAVAITGTAAAAEFPRLELGWVKPLIARMNGGAAAKPAKPAPAPKRVTVQEAGCGEIGLNCLAGDDISCIKFWLCKAKHDPPEVW